MKKLNDITKRIFPTGAYRNDNKGKFNYDGFINPAVENSFARYMHGHRKMEDGSLRDADNWQKGFSVDEIMQSLLRHVMDVHLLHRGYEVIDEKGEKITLEECLNGVKFNINAYILQLINEKKSKVIKRGE